jgi:hypothetical protein
VASCTPGWGNCDGVASNGCEANLSTDAKNCGSCGHACGSGVACAGGGCATSTSVVLNFPLSTDTTHIASGTAYWHAGDYVDGSRATTLASTVQAVIHIVLLANGLSACGTQPMEMLINGIVVGNFTITMGQTTIDATFTYPAIPGTTYDLRYQTTTTVATGCGSAGISDTGSTVTLQ